ncbi:MAG: stringent starvation protein A [marine bacterium B5-7]|nr:MAG: stringent starvation protein A [marine bacterium B5-7]
MSNIAHKRATMTLFCDVNDIESHRVRIVVAEKGVNVDITEVTRDEMPREVLELNPYQTLPMLLDRDLVLYQANVIMEYLDERFPHPPLLPVYPVMRAKNRLMIHRIERDWYSLARNILEKNDAQSRDRLTESLVAIAPVFAEKPFFLSEEYTMVDCCISALLWRLPEYGIELPAKAKPIMDYAERVFEREAFQASLTETEREIQEPLYV